MSTESNRLATPSRRTRGLFFGLAALAGISACGVQDGNDETELKQGALGAFGGWALVPGGGGAVNDAPAIAQTGTTTLTLFGRGFDDQIYETNKLSSGQWMGFWRFVTNNGPTFTSRPAAAGLAVTGGQLGNMFAIVARRSDKKYYIKIQDQTGGAVLMDWNVFPKTALFDSAPAVAFIPNNAPAGPKNSLVLAGLGTDGLFYTSTNTLVGGSNGTYGHANWTPVSPVLGQTFSSAPALTVSCVAGSGMSIIIAGKTAAGIYRWSKFNGTSWSAWTSLANGIFVSDPALAQGCGVFSRETTIYGRGEDSRMYVSTEIVGQPPSLNVIGTKLFSGNPTATGFGTIAHVVGNDSSSATFENSASSP